MLKIMVFIDGTWLYANMPKLAQLRGNPDFHIDYGLLPTTLAGSVADQLRMSDPDLVRTHLFGSIAENYDPRDEEAVRRRRDFYRMLKEEFHYEVDVFPINYYGHRLRPDDRDPDDLFEPKEKCVDIALATAVLFYAAMPYAYDIAIAVVGDRDFVPVFQAVRRLGKRVAIASIRGCCAAEYFDPEDRARLRDLDLIWLDEMLDKLELRYEPQLLLCESPFHSGDRNVWTTFRPRKGQRFYCDACRRIFQEQHGIPEEEGMTNYTVPYGPGMSTLTQQDPPSERMTGSIKTIKREKGYGFIAAEDGSDYFFHLTELVEELDWETLEENMAVKFDIKAYPSENKAGAAARVTPIHSQEPSELSMEDEEPEDKQNNKTQT